MKINSEPVSAFAIYSEKLKQKKKKIKHNTNKGINKSKGINKNNGTHTVKSKDGKEKLLKLQMEEVSNILQHFFEKSNNKDTKFQRSTDLLSATPKHIDSINMKKPENLINVHSKKQQKHKSDSSKHFHNKKVETKFIGSGKINKKNNIETKKNIQFKKVDTHVDPATNRLILDTGKGKYLPPVNGKACQKRMSRLRNKKLSKQMKVVDSNIKTKYNFTTKKKAKLMLRNGFKTKSQENSFEIALKTETADRSKLSNDEDSSLLAKKLFEWLILPVPEKKFMQNYWENKPLLIQREGNRNYFSGLLSTAEIDKILRENNIQFTKHLDVTSYTNGERETHNLSGRAQANVVWDFYSNGCSIRLLNPQAFLPRVHSLNATLQEYFGCFVGANVYLTPPNSQGFAPHYDDIEAFVLQIEGKKHWKVYPPRQVLPRFSSPNFSQSEIGKPFLDVILAPGDLLYFPRGWIHQAMTVEGEHSLHITLSAYQKTAWVDLLEKTFPIALKRAADEDEQFRKGLPRDYLGVCYHKGNNDQDLFMDTAQTLISKLGHYLGLSLGPGTDQMGVQLMHDALPPVLSPKEKLYSSRGVGLKMKNGKLENRIEFQMDTRVKLIRYNVCRLVEENDEVRLYHCLDNPLEYHAEEPQFFILPKQGIPVISRLLLKYPEFVPIKELQHKDKDKESLLTLISDLWDAGLLLAQDFIVVDESEAPE